MKTKTTILIFLIAFTACKPRNRLKTDEKQLVEQISAEEKEKQEAEAASQNNTIIPDTLPPGFRFKEDRRVDPQNPPEIIDFSDDLEIELLKLSDIAKKIKYIRLTVPNDSLYFARTGRLNFTNEYIIFNNNFGIQKFTRKGEFIESICFNELGQNRIPDKTKKFGGMFNKEDFKGAWVNHVSATGNKIFYKYTDYSQEKVELYSYNLNNKSLIIPDENESGNVRTFAKGKVVTTGKENIRSGTRGLASTQIEAVSSDCYAGFSRGLSSYDSKVMMVIFNHKGDTLCTFSQPDTLDTPITSSVIRSISTITSWHYNGVYTFKRAFNDTIFRLIPPNRLVPAFVFNFGEHKITDEDWYHFSGSLDGKIRPGAIYEADKFLLIEYRKYSPTSKKFGDNHYALFDKRDKKLVQLDFSDEAKNRMYHDGRKNSDWSAGFENDIDGGFPFWPQYVTPEGQFASMLKPELLKDFAQKTNFNNRTGDNDKFKSFTGTLTNNDKEVVIMIIE